MKIVPRLTLHHGHVLDVLRAMEPESVQCSVTSPPYWGLRDYGLPPSTWGDGWQGCIGLEPTPDQFLAHLVEVFAEVRRVLRGDGTCWFNMGDCYSTGSSGQSGLAEWSAENARGGGQSDKLSRTRRPKARGLAPKQRLLMPARCALALQADGWWVRSEIVWHKPNPMPSSVRDRPTDSHEMVYLLTKAPRYYYDADAIREADAGRRAGNREVLGARQQRMCNTQTGGTKSKAWTPGRGRNKRTVWTIPTQSFKGAHFATFPERLVQPCVLAGSKEGDVVMDPFSGSGTTGVVALALDRRYVGIELNPDYLTLSRERLGDRDELAKIRESGDSPGSQLGLFA